MMGRDDAHDGLYSCWQRPSLVAGCQSKPAAEALSDAGRGESAGCEAKTATIAAGKIGDWMEAMTMEYPVKPDAEFQKLHVGDKIDATVVVVDPTTTSPMSK